MKDEIDNLVSSHCDFCDYENSKPCLSCMKYIIYLGIKDSVSKNVFVFSELLEKIESLNDSLDGLTTEIYKYRRDLDMKSENPSNTTWT